MFHVSSQNASRLADIPADGAPGAVARGAPGVSRSADTQRHRRAKGTKLSHLPSPPPPRTTQTVVHQNKKKHITPLIVPSLVELRCASPAAAAVSLNLPSPTALWSRLLSHTTTSISRSVCVSATGLPSVCEMRCLQCCWDRSKGPAQQRNKVARCWKHFRKQTQS